MGITTLEGPALVIHLMRNLCLVWCSVLCSIEICGAQETAASSASKDHLILVVGAPGEEQFESEFADWAQAWRELAGQRQWSMTLINGEDRSEQDHLEGKPEQTPHAALQQAISDATKSNQRLWIVLIGHGTASRGVAKFNLAGPDVSTVELSNWLKPLTCQVVVVNCSSSSGPFLTELSGQNRILLTATRSGSEANFSRFGRYLSHAVGDLSADLDHDQEVSLLEAFLAATSQTERFYREEARLTTEHALLDDNGDKVGTSGDFYRGIRPAKQAAKGKQLDGSTAGRIILFSSPEAVRLSPEMERRRDEIEVALDSLRKRKSELTLEDYYDQLEQLLIEMNRIYTSH